MARKAAFESCMAILEFSTCPITPGEICLANIQIIRQPCFCASDGCNGLWFVTVPFFRFLRHGITGGPTAFSVRYAIPHAIPDIPTRPHYFIATTLHGIGNEGSATVVCVDVSACIVVISRVKK